MRELNDTMYREAVAEASRFEEMGRPLEALRLLDEAINRHPGVYALESHRARLAAMLLGPRDRLTAVRKYRDVFPHRSHPHRLLAEVLNGQARYKEALDEIEIAEQLDRQPHDADAAIRARILTNLGREAEARALLDPALGPYSIAMWLELNPPDTESQMIRATEQLRSACVAESQVLTFTAEWYLAHNMAERCIEFLEVAGITLENDLVVQFLLVRAESLAGRRRAALERALRVLEQEPTHPQLREWCTAELSRHGRFLHWLKLAIQYVKAQVSILKPGR